MRFSSVGATLRDDDGMAVNLNDLRLGMMVRVSGTGDDASQLGTASTLEVVHGTRGTVTAVDTALKTITLLGQTVKTDSNTAFHGVSGLAALSAGQQVEIYGALQPDGSLLATLVEIKVFSALSLSGPVSNLDTNNKTFTVGTLTINYSTVTVTGTLVNGARVKVKAAAGGLSGSTLTASAVQVQGAGAAFGSASTSGVVIKVKGVVEAAPLNGLLALSGTPVDISKARIEGGTTITAGSFIEVKGTWDGSTLQATKVELEDERKTRIGGRNELYGVVSSLSGTVATVNGVKVELAAANFSHGNRTQVVVGSYVEIKGDMAGDTLQALKVELKNGSEAKGAAYEQYGQVTDFVSLANFKLNGVSVDTTGAVFEGAAASAIANATYLEIKGAVTASGVFLATKVEIKTASSH
jgi:cytoskeletal protein CcmA (bactofilin family)